MLLLHLQWVDSIVVAEEGVLGWWLRSRKFIAKQVGTFGGAPTSPTVLASKIFEEAKEWSVAGYRSLAVLLAALRST